MSNLERKNVESIAYRFGHSRLPLQSFIGWDAWGDEPLRLELRHQVKVSLGQGDGVLVFDPSAFPKSGRQSVGVARQWCGRLGKVDNCQVAIYLGYVSRKGHTLVDQRLFLPKDWTKDKARLALIPKDTVKPLTVGGGEENPKLMRPQEVAALAVFLASDASSAITGTAIDAFGERNPLFA